MMAERAAADSRLPFPPYGSFVNFLDDLNAMDVLPNRLNQQVFGDSYSGSARWQILRAFRFFDLMGDDDAPNLESLMLLLNPATRKDAFARLLRERYKSLIELPLATAGPKEVNEWFAAQGMDAATTRKARAFFLTAATENGISLHQLVSARKPRSGPRVRRKARGRKEEPASPLVIQPPADSASSRSIELRSGGGRVTLSVSIDPMELEDDDRDFVFALISALKRYEKGEMPRISVSTEPARLRREDPFKEVPLKPPGAAESVK